MVTIFEVTMVLTRIPGLQSNGVLMAALKHGRKFVECFLLAMPLFKELLPTHQNRVVEIWKELQVSTRQMQSLAAHGKTHRVPNLAREAPAVRKVLESTIYAVKAACTASLVSPKDAGFFMIGSLKSRNVDGSIYTAPVRGAEEDEDEEEEEDEEGGNSDGKEEEDEDEEEAPPPKKKKSSKAKSSSSSSSSAPSKSAAASKAKSKKRPLPPLTGEDDDATESDEEEEGYGSLVASEVSEDEEEEDSE
jgi:hypothetical protein